MKAYYAEARGVGVNGEFEDAVSLFAIANSESEAESRVFADLGLLFDDCLISYEAIAECDDEHDGAVFAFSQWFNVDEENAAEALFEYGRYGWFISLAS